MAMSKKQLAILHVAKGKLALSEAQYRTALVQIAGVTSSTELDQGGFEAMMGFFEYLGFKPLSASGPDYGERPGMASFAQIELIRTIWSEYTNQGGEDALNKWLTRTFKVSSLRFLTMTKARNAIAALKHMKSRAA
ncbi:MAG: regulatory protein GemA [Loktanella sp.]|nr:regulatory protein GemA [Loktanella sp.]